MIGLLWAEGVVAEVVLFACAGERCPSGPIRLLIFAGALTVVRWALSALSTDLTVLVAAQALHAASFGATHIAAMHHLRDHTPPELHASAQGFYAAIGTGCPSACSRRSPAGCRRRGRGGVLGHGGAGARRHRARGEAGVAAIPCEIISGRHAPAVGKEGRVQRDPRTEFERDGFLVLPGFVPESECDALRARMAGLIAAFEPGEVATVFSTTRRSHAQDRYFLESGDQIRFFFEEEAFDQQGRLRQSKARSINKVGHALHDLDPVFARFTPTGACGRGPSARRRKAAPVAVNVHLQAAAHRRRGGLSPGCRVPAHRADQRARPVVRARGRDDGERLPLRRAGRPQGPLRSRFVRDGERTETVLLEDTPLPNENLVPLAVSKGTLIVLHGLLPHRSAPNRSAKSRHAYTLHVIDARARYSPDNWLRRAPDMPLLGFEI